MTFINKQYNYVFIHVPKAAGKSIKSHLVRHSYGPLRRKELQLNLALETLSAYAGNKGSLGNAVPRLHGTGIDPRVRAFCKKHGIRSTAHLRAEQVQASLGEEEYQAMFSFAFVRNPWDRCLSAYFYFRRKVFHPLHKLATTCSFEDFLLEQERNGMPHIAQQVDWIYRNGEEKLVDFVGSVESIDTDMATVGERIQLPSSRFTDQANVSEARGRDYRPYYSKRSADIVARSMQTDIELLRYSF